MCSLYWMQMGLLASVSYHIREGKAPSTRFFLGQDVLTTCNLFAEPACQFTQVVQHCTMGRTAAKAVSNQQTTQSRSNSGPHYMNRQFSTACRRPVHHHQVCSQSITVNVPWLELRWVISTVLCCAALLLCGYNEERPPVHLIWHRMSLPGPTSYGMFP